MKIDWSRIDEKDYEIILESHKQAKEEIARLMLMKIDIGACNMFSKEFIDIGEKLTVLIEEYENVKNKLESIIF